MCRMCQDNSYLCLDFRRNFLIKTGFSANGLQVFDPHWQFDLALLCGWHGFASSGC